MLPALSPKTPEAETSSFSKESDDSDSAPQVPKRTGMRIARDMRRPVYERYVPSPELSADVGPMVANMHLRTPARKQVLQSVPQKKKLPNMAPGSLASERSPPPAARSSKRHLALLASAPF